GHLKRFVQRKENPRPEHREANAVEEEKSAPGEQEPKQIAMSIWRPEDFYVPISAEFLALGRWENFPQAM
ncbi:hypothetical protein A2U01_0107784, partial [Trifolium medium]|nr:hypothetical protein [Trifolium medium]